MMAAMQAGFDRIQQTLSEELKLMKKAQEDASQDISNI